MTRNSRSQIFQNIKYIKDLRMCLSIILQIRDILMIIKGLRNPAKITIDELKVKGIYIVLINSPSLIECLTAVKQNGYVINSIDNPSEIIKMAAVQSSGCAIQHIENPSEEIQLAAVMQDYRALKYIKNPFNSVQLAALTEDHDSAIQAFSK